MLKSPKHVIVCDSALNCSDTLPKKQVFEMLSAICVYSHIGYLRVMESLSYVKVPFDHNVYS